jgi:hypothetical protein
MDLELAQLQPPTPASSPVSNDLPRRNSFGFNERFQHAEWQNWNDVAQKNLAFQQVPHNP